MIISHLVAVSNNFVIGKNNDLPWRLKKDLQHFSAYTQNKAMIMGRKTFESIGRPLPNRKNIVISTTMNPKKEIEIVPNLDHAMKSAKDWNNENNKENEIVIIGGGFVFEESKKFVNKLVLTRVNCEIEGDVFYPQMSLDDWKKISSESYEQDDENQFNFKIETYIRSSLIEI
ncbi:MAG: dihydrofolate reductase [Gammaproteobacteria bacterium]|nr:dihydrofolate reductase [Gammaproteobacteria bacterium]|tara:strand:- start:490 stop:1008 length:519 start_codon:yes stop_codon:yes gene_type:complete